jgi:hypothetical protein
MILLDVQILESATTDGAIHFVQHELNYYDAPTDMAINALFTYLEGSFGALIMVMSGIFAIVSAAFGNYRAAFGLFVVAVGAFVLRSFVGTFFNDWGIA